MTVPASEAFATIQAEGGLLPAALLARVAAGDATLSGMTSESYHLAPGERFGEAISRSWTRLQGAWRGFRQALERLPESDPATSLTREKWLLILFSELGYGRLQTAAPVEIGDKRYAVSHSWTHVPIHLVGARIDLERRASGVRGAAGAAPHGILQELLNRSPERLWGIVSNGLRLRVLRDNVALTRQAYLEVDLEAMMEEQAYADFTVVWLLLHQSRVEVRDGGGPETCWLERWSQEAHTQGTRALEHLRDGVASAIRVLGEGFLRHPDNAALRQALATDEFSAKDYYRQLLRVVYRTLFLLVAEERDLLLLPVPEAPPEVRQRYRDFYSIARIRSLAEKRRGTSHGDLWVQMTMLFRAIGTEGIPALALPTLGSTLFSPETSAQVDACRLANRDLLEAMRALSGRSDDRRRYRWRFDYRNLGAEELGSVYESLLELQPEVNVQARTFALAETGTERRATGSHYTPTSFIKRVLDFALEPQIAKRLAASDPEAALLDLRVIDIAAGSGHFLIAAAHRIARALAEVRTGESEPAPKRVREALRDVVARCIYGVDYNPMAVELCKVALWLETLQPGRPLSFLDHHIRLGNSLVGVPLGSTVDRNRAAIVARRAEIERSVRDAEQRARDLSNRVVAEEAGRELRRLRRERDACVYDSWMDSIPDIAFAGIEDDDPDIVRVTVDRNKRARVDGQLAFGLGNVLVELPDDLVRVFESLGDGAEGSVQEVTIRAARFGDAVRHYKYRHLRLLADTWTSAWFWPLKRGGLPAPTQREFLTLISNPAALDVDTRAAIDQEMEARRFFHFETAFPEVFVRQRGGFDVVLGNPPYLGGMSISSTFGDRVLAFLKGQTPEARGRTDLAVYFLRRSFDLTRSDGSVGLVTTNSISDGDSLSAGLSCVVGWGGTVVDAVRSLPWEGTAGVSVTLLHIVKGTWSGPKTLDGQTVSEISPALTSRVNGGVLPIGTSVGRMLKGVNPLGKGFFVPRSEAAAFLSASSSNAEVVKHVVGAEDVTKRPTLDGADYIIDFGARSEEEAAQYELAYARVRRLVKPQREELDEDGNFKVRDARQRERWWQFVARAEALTSRLSHVGWAIVMPEVSKMMLPVRCPSNVVFLQTVFVIPEEDWGLFGVLSSSFHWLWSAQPGFASALETRPRYHSGRCFETFPLPSDLRGVAAIAMQLDTHRALLMRANSFSLTEVYNRVADTTCQMDEIEQLRALHIRLDDAVAEAYGWGDLCGSLGHGVHQTERFGLRWTLSPEAQQEVLTRMLRLNQAVAYPVSQNEQSGRRGRPRGRSRSSAG